MGLVEVLVHNVVHACVVCAVVANDFSRARQPRAFSLGEARICVCGLCGILIFIFFILCVRILLTGSVFFAPSSFVGWTTRRPREFAPWFEGSIGMPACVHREAVRACA